MNDEDIQNLINQALTCTITSNVSLSDDQLAALQNLNEFCVNRALQTPEVQKKPLKIIYKSNEELKLALIAILLSHTLTNARRKLNENKNFFESNITIYHFANNVKEINFGKINAENVIQAINWEIIEDWKLYRDTECGGIKALVDEKTHLTGLKDYRRGGDPLYEFARFHRKFTEKENKIAEDSLIQAQNAYRSAVMQSVLSEVAKQQLLEGKNPMDVINSLLGQEENLQIASNSQKPKQITNKTEK